MPLLGLADVAEANGEVCPGGEPGGVGADDAVANGDVCPGGAPAGVGAVWMV